MTGSLQIKKGYYYAVLNIADKEGGTGSSAIRFPGAACQTVDSHIPA